MPGGGAGGHLGIQPVIRVSGLIQAIFAPSPSHELPHPGRRFPGNRSRQEARLGLRQVNQLLRHTLFIQNPLDQRTVPAGPA